MLRIKPAAAIHQALIVWVERVAIFVSGNPGKVLGIDNEFGSIVPGRYADFAVLDSGLKCVATFIKGKIVYGD